MSALPPTPAAPDPVLAGKKVMIVEDDPVITHVYVRHFKSAGCTVEHAGDGQAAMDLLERFTPDVVVLDLQMPKVNGIGVLKFIRAKPETSKIPVLVFSNAYLGSLVDAAWQAGASKCLSKAVTTPKQLLAVVRTTFTETAAGAAPVASPATAAPSLPALSAMPLPAAPAPAPAPASAPAPVPSPQVQPVAETRAAASLQAETNQTVLDKAPEIIKTLHSQLAALIQLDAAGKPVMDRGAKLQSLFETTRSLTGKAGLAGWRRIAQVSSALEALLMELDAHTEQVSPSVVRTLTRTVELLATLHSHTDKADPEPGPPLQVLIVHGNAAARKTITAALDKATMKGVAVDDGGVGMNIASKVDFKLMIVALDLSGMGGIELRKSLRESPRHRRTPVILVTGEDGLKPAAASVLGPADDWIAMPFPGMELTLKSLSCLVRSQLLAPEQVA